MANDLLVLPKPNNKVLIFSKLHILMEKNKQKENDLYE